LPAFLLRRKLHKDARVCEGDESCRAWRKWERALTAIHQTTCAKIAGNLRLGANKLANMKKVVERHE